MGSNVKLAVHQTDLFQDLFLIQNAWKSVIIISSPQRTTSAFHVQAVPPLYMACGVYRNVHLTPIFYIPKTKKFVNR